MNPRDYQRLPPFRIDELFVSMAMGETIDWGLKMAGIPEVWRKSRGKKIIVGIADTGKPDHSDIEILDAKDFTESRSGVWDKQGHSTHVCGIIGATDNEQGVIGVAPECDMMTAKVLGDNGSGSSKSVSNGVRWLTDAGCHIINMSLGSSAPSSQILNAIKYANSKGCFVIAAAGNSGPGSNTVDYPGRWKEVCAVGSIKESLRVSRFSSRGPEVDIAAPGELILSCYLNNTYSRLSGTSMATPFVAGAAALILSKHLHDGGNTPVRNINDMIEHLTRGHRDAGRPGRDDLYGIGIIDVRKWFTDNPQPGPGPVDPEPDPNPGDGMTKDQLLDYINKALVVARTLQPFVPQISVLITALEFVKSNDWAVNILLWIINYTGLFSEEELLAKAVQELGVNNPSVAENQEYLKVALKAIKEAVQ